jgi:diamine N-acetyltransferase
MPGGAEKVTLQSITAANRAAVEALELAAGQEDLVATNLESLEEADEDPCARPRAIYADDRLVGFLMYDTPDEGLVTIYRFMIDRREQGKGYGRRALVVALEEIRAMGGAREVSICYMPENVGARHLYRSAGFDEVDVDEDGEIIALLPLTSEASR